MGLPYAWRCQWCHESQWCLEIQRHHRHVTSISFCPSPFMSSPKGWGTAFFFYVGKSTRISFCCRREALWIILGVPSFYILSSRRPPDHLSDKTSKRCRKRGDFMLLEGTLFTLLDTKIYAQCRENDRELRAVTFYL
jgi:hypothetical protein